MNEERGRIPSKADVLWNQCLAWLEWRKTIKQDDMESDETDPVSLITAAMAEAREKAEAELAQYREKIVPLYDEAYAKGKRESESDLSACKERVRLLQEYSEEYVQQRDEAIIAEKAINGAYLHQYRRRKWALHETIEWRTKYYGMSISRDNILRRARELENLIQYVLDCDMAEQEFDAQRLWQTLQHKEGE